jgi:flagellar hook-associated protein 3 FlgL
MRISTSQIFDRNLGAMLDQQSLLSKIQQQLSTGQKIINPSDDPSGSARVLDLTQVQALTTQYNENITFARNRLQLEESVLESVGEKMHRLRELAVQGNNDTQSDDTRVMIATEVREILDEIYGLANTVDANGEYIFAGFQSLTTPFAQAADGTAIYNGDQGQRFLQIGQDTQLPVSDSGAAVFMSMLSGNGTIAGSTNAGNVGTGVLGAPQVVDPTVYNNSSYQLYTGAATTAVADGGATVGLFTDTGTADLLQYDLRINGQLVYSQDNATGTPIATVDALANQINAATGTTGVRAETDGTQLVLINSPASTADIQVDEALNGATDLTDTFSGYFGATLSGAVPANSTTYTQSDAYIAIDGTGVVASVGGWSANGVSNFDGVQFSISGEPAMGDRFDLQPSSNTNLFDMVLGFAEALEAGANNGAELAQFHGRMNNVLQNLDEGLDDLLVTRAKIGGRMNKLDRQENSNSDFDLQLQTAISEIRDIDFAKVISEFQQQTVALQAAQQSFARIQGLSLFNYL